MTPETEHPMTREQFLEKVTTGAGSMGVDLDDTGLERMFLYYAELERWNRRVNLVSRQTHDWVRAHFLDSLAPLGIGLLKGPLRMVDLGAGAGFPGVPLKVARAGFFLGMAEVSAKKCAWLRHLARTLGVEGAEVLEGRFEEWAVSSWAGSFDVAVSRAAAKPGRILELARPFLAPEGRVLIYTTEALVEKGLGRVHPYRVPGSRVPSVIWEVQV